MLDAGREGLGKGYVGDHSDFGGDVFASVTPVEV
jgi:hypothetical protein